MFFPYLRRIERLHISLVLCVHFVLPRGATLVAFSLSTVHSFGSTQGWSWKWPNTTMFALFKYECMSSYIDFLWLDRFFRVFWFLFIALYRQSWRWEDLLVRGRSQGSAHCLGIWRCPAKNWWGVQEWSCDETHRLRTGKVGHCPLNHLSSWEVEEAASPLQSHGNPQ